MNKIKNSYFINIESPLFPFVSHGNSFRNLETSNEELQEFIKSIEKKFDAIWYIGSDILGDEVYERFMFHHGGFMEISLKGKLRCYFEEDKVNSFKEALFYAVDKMSYAAAARHLVNSIKSGQRLISIKDSIINSLGGKK